jgi:signal transduction histidine kinase
MPLTEQDRKDSLRSRAVARTVLFYAAFASLWIYASDALLKTLIADPDMLTRVQTIKGWLFVALTTLLLFFYLHRCMKTLSNQEAELDREQSRTRKELEDRFSQLSSLFDSLNAIVYVADMESYELLYVNRHTADLFDGDWRGRTCHSYLQAGCDSPCDFCTNAQLVVDGEPSETVAWEFLNTRNRRWYACFDKAIRWTDGRLVRLEVALDVTERKELEQLKNDLLSTMSHEMRTPLTAISGFAELLAEDSSLSDQASRQVEIINRETAKLTDLINEFLDIRRLKIDRSRIDYEPLSISDLLNKACRDNRDCSAKHGIAIDCPDGLPVYGNRNELTQVFRQLLVNACRYSPEGGDIAIRVVAQATEVAISVSDRGIGIPPHELEAIFNPFHRLDTGDRRRTGGVGLGLCVAREIIHLHGGSIAVDSEVGKGSTFTVCLPRAGADRQQPPAQSGGVA